MIFEVSIIKEKSRDPFFLVNISVDGDSFNAANFQIEVLRLPPKISYKYPDNIKKALCETDQKKLELEILNKIAEHIIREDY